MKSWNAFLNAMVINSCPKEYVGKLPVLQISNHMKDGRCFVSITTDNIRNTTEVPEYPEAWNATYHQPSDSKDSVNHFIMSIIGHYARTVELSFSLMLLGVDVPASICTKKTHWTQENKSTTNIDLDQFEGLLAGIPSRTVECIKWMHHFESDGKSIIMMAAGFTMVTFQEVDDIHQWTTDIISTLHGIANGVHKEHLPQPGGDVDRFFRMSVSTHYQNIDAVGEMVKGYFPTLSVVPV